MLSSGFILGEDGKVHMGEVTVKFSATIMAIDCHVTPLRPIGMRETWWADDPHRICGDCMREASDG